MPSLLAAAAPVERSETAVFSINAAAEPGVLPRLVELFAKRGLVPTFWRSALSPDGRALSVEIGMRGMARDMSDYFAASMRQVIGVEVVLTSFGVPARPDGLFGARGAGSRQG